MVRTGNAEWNQNEHRRRTKERMQRGKKNYQKELEKVIAGEQAAGNVPSLLLHSCCAPCSSYVLEYLSQYFAITVFYYNPNIYPEQEYQKRVEEQRRLIGEMNASAKERMTNDRSSEVGSPAGRGDIQAMETGGSGERYQISFREGPFDPKEFYEAVKGLEQIPEGGERCRACFRLRLSKAAETARRGGFDYFTTTLTISPLKDAQALNAIGEELASEEVRWLPSDFKKKNGYKRSIELSAEYGLYRQDYCGCVFSRREREEQERRRQEK